RELGPEGNAYEYVDVRLDKAARTATLTVRSPSGSEPAEVDAIVARGAKWWPLAMARELDDAILMLRTNHLEIGTWILETAGDLDRTLACDAVLAKNAGHWFVRETIGMLRRTLAWLGVTSRTALGLVTAAPDELDWDDEVRIAIEERASLSPDALSGMEANLRFGPNETMETRLFGRLSAWQNWVFNRPNATGEQGALKVFGTGHKAKFNWERV